MPTKNGKLKKVKKLLGYKRLPRSSFKLSRRFIPVSMLFLVLSKRTIAYSHLSNKGGGWNKRGGGAKVARSIIVEVGILQLESSPFVFK